MAYQRFAIAACLAFGMAQTSAGADDFETSVKAPLQAYRAGDIETVKGEIDFATQSLGQLKAEALAAFLPEPMDGWAREVDDIQTDGPAMLGGGQTASRIYRKDGMMLEIKLLAGTQVVIQKSLLGNPFKMGKVKRVAGQTIVLTNDGELSAWLDKVIVQISGSASEQDKIAYFEAMDHDGLGDF